MPGVFAQGAMAAAFDSRAWMRTACPSGSSRHRTCGDFNKWSELPCDREGLRSLAQATEKGW